MKTQGAPSLPRVGNPKRQFPNCHSKTPRSRCLGTLRVTEPPTTSLRDCWSVVTRHRAMADGTRRTSRDLGTSPHDQNPARPASEVVRDPVHCSARKKGREGGGGRGGRGAKDPAAHKGRGPKDPAPQTLSGVVAPFRFLQGCCGNY